MSLQLQLLQQHHQQQQQQQRSVEGERRLPRQDAVAEEVDVKETDPLKVINFNAYRRRIWKTQEKLTLLPNEIPQQQCNVTIVLVRQKCTISLIKLQVLFLR